MDDYNIFGSHAYLGSPLGGLHKYQLTLFWVLHSIHRGGTTYIKTPYTSKYLHRSYDRLCTSLLLRNKNSSKKKKKKKLSSPVHVNPGGETLPAERKLAKYMSIFPLDHQSARIALYFIAGPCSVPASGATQARVPQ
jgi:hypothetical protein